MKKIFALLLLTIGCTAGIAQNRSDVRYYDTYWNPVLRKEAAKYYRKIKDADSVYRVTDYIIETDVIVMDGYYSSISPQLVHHGKTSWYFDNGGAKKSGSFNKNKPIGIHLEYWPNGHLQSEIVYEKDQQFYSKRFDENGNSLLSENGDGVFISEYWNKQYTNEVEEFLLKRSYYVAANGDTIYGTATKTAVYLKGGRKGLNEDLKRFAVYPSSMKKQGVEGTVWVSFVVDKMGNLQNIEVLQALGAAFTDSALKAVQRLKDWKPATYQGVPVPMRFVVPVNFVHTLNQNGYFMMGGGPTFYIY
jgi:periplasmic protein TonB